MASDGASQVVCDTPPNGQHVQDAHHEGIGNPQMTFVASRSRNRTPELSSQHHEAAPDTLDDIPDTPDAFDWDDFEKRYEEALRNADEAEKQIMKEAESLSAYFQSWASAASAHDDERAVKRLQTRKRFVNISEEKMEQKQQHCKPSHHSPYHELRSLM
jgi:hypothetical protein